MALGRKLWSTPSDRQPGGGPDATRAGTGTDAFEALLALADEAQRDGNTELSRTFHRALPIRCPRSKRTLVRLAAPRGKLLLAKHPATNQQSAWWRPWDATCSVKAKAEAAVAAAGGGRLGRLSRTPSTARNWPMKRRRSPDRQNSGSWPVTCYLRLYHDWSTAPRRPPSEHLLGHSMRSESGQRHCRDPPCPRCLMNTFNVGRTPTRSAPPNGARLAERQGDWLAAAEVLPPAVRQSHVAQIGRGPAALPSAGVHGRPVRVHDFLAQAVDSLVPAVDTESAAAAQLLLAADLYLAPLARAGSRTPSCAADQGGQTRTLEHPTFPPTCEVARKTAGRCVASDRRQLNRSPHG